MNAVGAEAMREFAYSKKDFERARRLIMQRAGISLAPCKEDMVYGRLARRVRQHGLDSVGDYLDFLERGDEAEEWQAFTNALTTNLTAFFREPHHFEVLRGLFERLHRGEKLKLWCAAASTGEEPYSLAMTALEHFGVDAPVRILATDIDTQVLDTASRGIYPLQRVEKLDAQRLRRFFRRGTGDNDGQCRVTDELRSMIEFRPLNLLEGPWNLRGPFDAIFCRNVMIYFDKPTQYKVLSRVMPLLARDGLFFAGHSESFFHAADLLRSCGRTVYAHAGTGN